MGAKKKGRKAITLDAALSDPDATNSIPDEQLDLSALSTVLAVSHYLLVRS